MRKYIITYWIEFRDNADWREKYIEAGSLEEALEKFQKDIKIYKRIESIIEK